MLIDCGYLLKKKIMGRYIDIEKIVPVDCPLDYDDCYYCENFGQDCRGFICHAETEDNKE